MNKKLLIIIITSTLLKVWLVFGSEHRTGLNFDEKSAWNVAQNHIDGHGYSIYDNEHHNYKPTAFHGAFTVLLYEQLILHKVSRDTWVLIIQVLSVLVFIAAVYAFYQLSGLYLQAGWAQLGCVATYAFYPSVQYYIGSNFLYENLAGALFIIILGALIKNQRRPVHPAGYLLLPAGIALSCWFRPQLLVIYALTFGILMVLSVKKAYILKVALLSAALTWIGFYPSIQKNKQLFGVSMLSTQSGFELLQGHSPVARGSWMNQWRSPGNALYIYAHENIPELDTLNEYAEAEARKKLAIDYSLHHPVDEVVLSARKVAIYFLPFNFEERPRHWWLDMITGLFQLLFLSGIVYFTWTRNWSTDLVILCTPVAASLLLTLIFYVGYRWRFYAEPFMILFAWLFVNEGIKELKNGKRTL